MTPGKTKLYLIGGGLALVAVFALTRKSSAQTPAVFPADTSTGDTAGAGGGGGLAGLPLTNPPPGGSSGIGGGDGGGGSSGGGGGGGGSGGGGGFTITPPLTSIGLVPLPRPAPTPPPAPVYPTQTYAVTTANGTIVGHGNVIG